MSKMSQLHAELSEQASELGFESIEQAEANGYIVKIDMNGNGWLEPDVDKAYKEKHKMWLKERNIIIDELEMLMNDTQYKVYKDTLSEAIKFIKEQCHD